MHLLTDLFCRHNVKVELKRWRARGVLLGLFFTVLPVGGCSTHFYQSDGDTVTLYLKNSTARSIIFLCSLDGYTGQQLKKHNDLWEVRLSAEKQFRYFYIVDGNIFLPPCRFKEKDDFGSENCIFEPKL